MWNAIMPQCKSLIFLFLLFISNLILPFHYFLLFLEFQIVSRLTLFRSSALIWIWSCSLVCFHLSRILKFFIKLWLMLLLYWSGLSCWRFWYIPCYFSKPCKCTCSHPGFQTCRPAWDELILFYKFHLIYLPPIESLHIKILCSLLTVSP